MVQEEGRQMAQEEINEKVYKSSGLGRWFGEESADKTPGWDRYNTKGERVGKCGDAKKGESYPCCMSKQKARRLGKKGRATFCRRKKSAQRKSGYGKKKDYAGSGRKPTYVRVDYSKGRKGRKPKKKNESIDLNQLEQLIFEEMLLELGKTSK